MDRTLKKTLSTEELMQRCLDNPDDKDALQQLLMRYHDFIRMKAHRYLTMVDLKSVSVDDVMQDVFQKVVFAIRQQTLRPFRSFEGYISVMIKNMVIDHARLDKRISYVPPEQLDFMLENEEQNPLERISSEESKKLLKEAMKKTLSNTERQIINLSLDGFSPKEIAKKLDIGIDSVYSLRWRSLDKLRTYTKKIEFRE